MMDLAASPFGNITARRRKAQRRGGTATAPLLTAAVLLACNALFNGSPVEAGTGDLSLSVDHAPCVRLFHSGGDVGCRTPTRGGVTGPLLLVDSEGALKDIEALSLPTSRFRNDKNANQGEAKWNDSATVGRAPGDTSAEATLAGVGDDGLIAVLPEAFLNASVLHRLSATGRLGGVMVLQEEAVDAGKRDSAESGGVGTGGAESLAMGVAPSSSTSSGERNLGGRDDGPTSNPGVKTPQGVSTPSAAFDVDASYPWNPHGDGLLMESLDFPVVLVTTGGGGDSAAEVRARASANGVLGGSSWQYPLHMGRMSFYFGGSAVDLNSQECLAWTDIRGDRAPQCKPLGGQSSWASVGGAGSGDRETVFAVAGMDSTSMFHDRAPGANSAVSGLVALLSAADSIGAIGRSGEVDFSALPRQIVFAAFQAEAFGFTGSRRFLQDWLGEEGAGVACRNDIGPDVSPTGRAACLDPLHPSLEFRKLGRPAHVVSVDQVGCLPESTLWIHPSAGASPTDQATISTLSPGGEGGIVLANATETELPPSPLTSFVKADSQQSGFVVSGYDESFACPAYHSRLDTRSTIDAGSVAAAAEVVAKATLVLAGGTEANAQAVEVNVTLVEVLLDCILEDWSCDTLKQYVVGELANMEESLGFRVSVEAPFPPTMYTGPLEFRSGGGMPTVRHTKDDGSWKLHPSWTETFDPDHDKIQLVPNLLEIFCRAFLSEQAGSAHAGRYGETECRFSRDCPAEACQEEENEPAQEPQEGGSGRYGTTAKTVTNSAATNENTDSRRAAGSTGGGRPECVRGRCGCPSGFHHIALGVGLEREDKLNLYRVVGGAVEQGAPLWTEPNWRKIGVEVYLDPGSVVGKVLVGVGAAVTAVAGFTSWLLFRSLDKLKLM